MAVRKFSAPQFAFDLRVSLRDIQPEIWRLIRVPHDIRMDRLHAVLQAAFGWTNSHLHQFIIKGEGPVPLFVRDPRNDDEAFTDQEPRPVDERKVMLHRFLTQPGDRLTYEYDFGDDWMHELSLVAVHNQTTRLSAALCLDGARACPPEDCGGPPGYEDFLAAIRDPKHEEHESMKEWIGGEFDPEAFDFAGVARALSRVKA